MKEQQKVKCNQCGRVLRMEKGILKELRSLAEEITGGNWPAPQPAPAHMPENVKIYGNGKVGFFLAK